MHVFIHIINYIHVFLRAVPIICIRHTHPCVSTYVSMDIFIISHHLAIEAFRGSEPWTSPKHLPRYGYFLFSGRKIQKNKWSLPLHIQGTWHEGDRESWRSLKNKISQSFIRCCLPLPHHFSMAAALWGRQLSSQMQWVSCGNGRSSTFVPKRTHPPHQGFFPKSKNQIRILLFPQKVESMAISFRWQRFPVLTTCVCSTKPGDGHAEDVALN